MTERQVVLLTGAEGHIGRGFRDEYVANYSDVYELKLGVRDQDFGDDRFSPPLVFDLDDMDDVRRVCSGVDTIIHMAANADWQADFDGLIGPNIQGAYNLFQAALEAGCRRVVFASSVHTIMGYPVEYQAHTDDPPRPDTLYGATKVFGEALCSVFSAAHELSCLAIRIGAYVSKDDETKELGDSANPQLLDIAITQRDMAQLIHRCIQAPQGLKFAILNGLSKNRFRRMDLEPARRLVGYEPQDDAWRMSRSVILGSEEKV